MITLPAPLSTKIGFAKDQSLVNKITHLVVPKKDHQKYGYMYVPLDQLYLSPDLKILLTQKLAGTHTSLILVSPRWSPKPEQMDGDATLVCSVREILVPDKPALDKVYGPDLRHTLKARLISNQKVAGLYVLKGSSTDVYSLQVVDSLPVSSPQFHKLYQHHLKTYEPGSELTSFKELLFDLPRVVRKQIHSLLGLPTQ